MNEWLSSYAAIGEKLADVGGNVVAIIKVPSVEIDDLSEFLYVLQSRKGPRCHSMRSPVARRGGLLLPLTLPHYPITIEPAGTIETGAAPVA